MSYTVGVTTLRLATAKDQAVIRNSYVLQKTTLQLPFVTDCSVIQNELFTKECIFNGRKYAYFKELFS